MIVKLKGFIEFCSEEYIDLDVNGIVFSEFLYQIKVLIKYILLSLW